MTDTIAQLFAADFFVYALLAGVCLALACGPLGSFVVWRRMSFFGDTLAHSALLGVAIGLMTGGSPQLSIVTCSLVLALILTLLDRRPSISTDTLLGILSHGMLAVGVVFLALTGSVGVNLEAYLFGALLTIGGADLLWVVAVTVLAGLFLSAFWNDLLSITVHAELAEIEGVDVRRLELMLTVSIALIIAVAMKIVGVLLITSLLIIPPAAARRLADSPERMAGLAGLIGAVSVVSGLVLSFLADTPAGPSVVVVAMIFFVLLYILPGIGEA